MKIITSNAVYVQKNDIGYLSETDIPIPASVFMKVFGNRITIIDDSNRYEFVKFEEESEIEYFASIDWIVDYDSVKNMDEEQILNLGQKIAQEKNDIAESFNAMSDVVRMSNMHMVAECEKLDFKMYSLRDILWFKQGHLHFPLPEDIDYPESYKKSEEKGLKRLLRKIKRNHDRKV